MKQNIDFRKMMREGKINKDKREKGEKKKAYILEDTNR